MSIKQFAHDFYMDWFNNYLTIEAVSDAYGIPESLGRELIEYGRSVT